MADSDGGTRNVVGGSVSGPFVQAGHIHGDVTIYPWRPRLLPSVRTLPFRVPDFTDRERFRDELDDARARALADGVPLLVVCTGRGGIGKTELVTWWLWRIADEVPGAHLYANLNEDGAVSAKRVLERFLRLLGVPAAEVPHDLGELSARFRSLTAEQPVIVYLDDARLASQVRPLLPTSAGSVVAVTSRNGLGDLPGARFVRLTPMTYDASMDLLARVAGKPWAPGERPDGEALVGLCDGLPLTLRSAGVRLAGRSAAGVAAEVRDEQDRSAGNPRGDDLSVRAVFDAGYRRLSVTAAALYRGLGALFGREFPADLAAAVAGRPEVPLEELVSAGLVEDLGAGRYRFHDLALEHARALASRAEREAASRRIVEWYLRTAVAADLAVMPGRWRLGPRYARYTGPSVDRDDAWAWLESERSHLRAAVRTAAYNEWDTMVVELCEALWGLYFFGKYHDDWIATHREGVTAAVRAGDRRFEGRMRCQLGFALIETGDLDEAAEQFGAARDADRSVGHARGEATAVESLGLLSLRRSGAEEPPALRTREPDFADRALTLLTENLELNLTMATDADDDRAVALAWRHRGRALSAAGRHEEAQRHLLRARELIAAVGDRYNEGRALTNLGEAYLRAGRLGDAETELTRAVELLGGERSRTEESAALETLAEAALRAGDRNLAVERLTRALALLDEGRRGEELRSRIAELTDPE